ncbi:MAG: S8 family serine peptidase [Chlorobiaceae bacterium]|nr:S8 family serine peptidase [Chlorobiaceae bacterium]
MVDTYRPGDPLLAIQWHFSMIGRLGFTTLNDTSGIERVWADYTGNGVQIGIWDDGVENSHWDLTDNYDPSRHVTVEELLNNGLPTGTAYGHGTAVAGLIAAENNGTGGVGVAFDSTLTSIRIFGGADDINSNWSRYILTLDALSSFDVTNHSYGSSPDFDIRGDIAKFQASALNGRNELGTINFKSAGNGNVDGNGDSLDASRFTITVAAVDGSGQVASYSSYGSHILVSAPAGSVTTDLVGVNAGYNGLLNGDYTSQFGGTSASSPITAGIAALMLEADHDLGWRDVQKILSYSATGTGSLYTGVKTNEDHAWKWNGAADWNGGGLHYSEDYGYGVVNAFNAVRMAEAWQLFYPESSVSSNEAISATGTISIGWTIRDLSTLSYAFQVNQDIALEHIDMTVSLSHTYFPDLRIWLISPEGTRMSLYNGSSGNSSTSDYGLTYTFGIDGLQGESSQGIWTLQIQDAMRGDSGKLHSLSFTGYGTASTTDNVYHYTDEVLQVLSTIDQSQRKSLADTNGGNDWIDASAMYRDLTIDLNPGASSSLNGTVFLEIAADSLIENAVGGDGNDLIIGNGLDNILSGMRGDDTIEGGAGNDTAVFMGNHSDYDITYFNGITTVKSLSGKFGNDTLNSIEFLRFNDVTIENTSESWTPTDTLAPSLKETSPGNNATAIAPDTTIMLTFDEEIRAGTGNIGIYTAAGAQWCSIAASDTTQILFSADTLTIDPANDFEEGCSYYVTIEHGAITDLSDNCFAGLIDPADLNFTTRSSYTTITGTSGSETLKGTTENNRIEGLAGNDKLYGYDGNDILDGGSGSDLMYGGKGNDICFVDSTSDRIYEYANEGSDTVQTALTSYTLGANIENLVYTSTAAFSGKGNTLNNMITGGSGNDTLVGNSGNDTLKGGDGNDNITGSRGTDLLFGGEGSDTFIFNSITEAGIGENRDIIADFSPGDRINLSAIDANIYSSGNQAFIPVIAEAFSGIRGQLCITSENDNKIVTGDVNGDRIADFEIMVLGVDSLTANDFVL